MNREDIIAMAREAWYLNGENVPSWHELERFAQLVAQTERNKVAQWMIRHSYATGHGDTVEDLLKELEWQVAEAENEACAKVCEALDAWNMDDPGSSAANAIRARGQQ